MKFCRCKETIAAIAITENPIKQLYQFNHLLAEFYRSNHYSDTLHLFHQIHSSHHLKPDHYTLSTTVAASAACYDTITGNQLHGYAIRAGLKDFSHVGNTLLSLYAKSKDLVSVKKVYGEIKYPDVYSRTTLLSACCKLGQIGYACKVFDEMPNRDVAVWNAIITGCAENGCYEIGLDLFKEMHWLGVRHDNYSFASVLSLCCLELLEFGRMVHSLVIKTGFFARVSVVNALLTMYFNCRNVVDAYGVFEEAEFRDQITFNVMMDGLGSLGRNEEALIMFREMQDACLRPTELTFVSLMSSLPSAKVGYQVHSQAIKTGFEAFTSVSNSAINMYSDCGDIHAAYMVFEKLQRKDIVSWNTIISSHSQVNLGRPAIFDYLQMQRAGIEPDEFTFGSLLASSESLDSVEMFHALVIKNGLNLIIQVSNALISAYSKHGRINQACRIFHNIASRNLISWNTIISGFLFNGFPMQGVEHFSGLLSSEVEPNAYTLSLILSICASISALRHGKEVHGYILRFGLSSETSLGNALITLYAKCGVLDWSLRVFSEMNQRDTVSWNAMISAYAQHGEGKEAVRCFDAMETSGGIIPDHATFTAVLSGCSHAGLVDDGSQIFSSMVNNYGIMPSVDHFSCIVDLLGRAGYLEEAERITNSEHFKAHSNIWWTLFSACAAHGNLRLGRKIAEFLLETEQDNPSVYVLLSNIYAAAGQWEEVACVRDLMTKTGVMKQPACTWIQ